MSVNTDDLQHRIESSAALKRAAGQLRDEVAFRADKSVEFDPMLIIMIVSIIVQLIIHCRETNTSDEVRQNIRDLRALPVRRLLRLRRKLNTLWREKCRGSEVQPDNPLLAAVYELSETADDAAIDEIMRLAENSGAA
jgi:hypothetical protein